MAGRATGILVAVTLVSFAAACSSGGHKAGSPATTSPGASTPRTPRMSGPAATVDACKLVTQQEASALFGHPAMRGTTATPTTCEWRASWAGAGGTVEYRLQVHASPKGATQSINVVQNSSNNVSGAGSASVSNDSDTVQTAKNGKSVTLAYSVSAQNVPNPPRASSRHAQLNELARNALERM